MLKVQKATVKLNVESFSITRINSEYYDL